MITWWSDLSALKSRLFFIPRANLSVKCLSYYSDGSVPVSSGGVVVKALAWWRDGVVGSSPVQVNIIKPILGHNTYF